MAVKKIFRRLEANAGEIKLAPQEEVVFNAIPKSKAGIERAALIEKLDALVADGTLKTKQKAATILGYYTKHLVDSKLVEVEKIEEAPAKKEAEAA